MKTLSLPKLSWLILFLSLPFNFLAIKGIGSIYFTTLVLFLNFLLVFVFTKGRIVCYSTTLIAFFILGIFVITTTLNVIFSSVGSFKDQLVFSIIHLQLIVAFTMGNYYVRRLNRDFIYRSLIIIFLLLSFRLFIDDFDKVFNLSTVRGLRVESYFAGGANNFALFLGIGFVIAFFFMKKGVKKLVTCVFLLIIIILTMSRGALFGVVLTIFAVALYEKEDKTLFMLLRISFVLVVLGISLYFISDGAQIFFEKFSDRFLSYFTGESTFQEASSGRGMIIMDLYEDHLKKANLFQLLFGHGMGSINFTANGYPYESSHNVFIDVLFRNGLIPLIGFLLLFFYMAFSFYKERNREDLVIFGVFVFIHFEILVNPFVYAAQSGWIYGVFLALFLGKKHLANSQPQILRLDEK